MRQHACTEDLCLREFVHFMGEHVHQRVLLMCERAQELIANMRCTYTELSYAVNRVHKTRRSGSTPNDN